MDDIKYYYILCPKKYRTSKWNYMRVGIVSNDGFYSIVINKKGKKFRINNKWIKAGG